MSHIPHLYLPGPWMEPVIPLSDAQIHHLERVLRRSEGSPVGYTDGRGISGMGVFEGGAVRRGSESVGGSSDIDLTMAVAPPDSRDRARFLVEKLAELGVARLVWIQTRFCQGRPPHPEKTMLWTVGALEQSRGDRLMEVQDGALDSLTGSVLVADPSGGPMPDLAESLSIVIGPEGGWSPGEVEHLKTVGLGRRILRTETAAIVAAGLCLARPGGDR